MSWLSSFWNHNRNFLGNAIKNVAPAAFLIPGVGPGAAAALGGLGSALGQGIRKGSNLGSILKAGATGAGEAYGGAQLTGGEGHSLSRLKQMFQGAAGTGGGGGSASGSLATSSGGDPIAEIGARGMPPVQFTPSSAVVSGPGSAMTLSPVATGSNLGGRSALSSALGSAGSAARGAGSFAKDNAMAMAMGLQGVGQLASLPAQNALARAQQQQLDLQNQQAADDLDEKRKRDEALAPLWKLIYQHVQDNMDGPGVAQNPYSVAGYQPRTPHYS